jgi:hypothetical protein
MAKKSENKVRTNYEMIQVGEIYEIVSDHHHGGKKIKIEDISDYDIVVANNGKRFPIINGRLLNSSTKINVFPIDIKDYYDRFMLNVNYSKLKDFDIIKLSKNKDKRAIVEFVKRFKKMPKIK